MGGNPWLRRATTELFQNRGTPRSVDADDGQRSAAEGRGGSDDRIEVDAAPPMPDYASRDGRRTMATRL
jgi:ribosomal protein S12 methylthiotransferase accessory factor YcaO